MSDYFTPEELAMFRDHVRRVEQDLEWLKERSSIGIGGRILESHEENGVTVIDSWEITEVSLVMDPVDKHCKIYQPTWLDWLEQHTPMWLLVAVLILEGIWATYKFVNAVWTLIKLWR